jgi:curli production assembly/transport component CsgF
MHKSTRVYQVIVAALLLMLSAMSAQATELTWAPVNPSFVGGDPLNGSYLLNSALSQDNNKDPASITSTNRLDDFTNNLNSSILSLLSAKIVEKAFGTDQLPNGTFTVGDFKVTVSDNITNLNVTVQDVPNKNTTTINIPILQ